MFVTPVLHCASSCSKCVEFLYWYPFETSFLQPWASMRPLSQLTCSHAATPLNSPRKSVSLGQPQFGLRNRGPNTNAHPDGLWIDFGSILAAQMNAKSRPTGRPDTLADVYHSQIDKNKVFVSFVLALSTLRKCNLIVKTLVFSNISPSSM